MSMSISGIVSGLDTIEIVESLMRIEAQPRNLLQNKVKGTENFITALKALNSKVDSLAENAKKIAAESALDLWKGTSSDSSVTVKVADGAGSANLEFRVNQLAQGRSILSAELADAADLLTNGMFTFTTGTGENATTHEVTPASSSLQDLAEAINADAEAGLRATVITTGGAARLQLSQTATGADAGQFEITSGTAEAGFQTVRSAQDAQITLWPDLNLEGATITSASNTFEELVPGVDLTVSKVTDAEAAPVTVTVERDPEAISERAAGLISQVSQVLSEISSRSGVSVSSGSDGASSVSGGLFTGDSTAGMIASRVTQAVMYPVDGFSPSSIGIELDRDGGISFNAEAFEQALARDPAGTQEFLATIAERVQGVGESYSDKYEGTLTKRIQSQEGLVADYGRQIERWDSRLEKRRQTLIATFTAMEVALSNMQSQGDWLAGQLSSLQRT